MAPTSLFPPPRPEHRWRQNRNAARSFSWLLRKGHMSHLRRPLPASMWQISHRQDSPYGFRAPGGRGRKIRMNAGGNKWGLAPAPEGPWGVGRGSAGRRRPQSATDARPRAGGLDTRKRRNALQRSVLFYAGLNHHSGLVADPDQSPCAISDRQPRRHSRAFAGRLSNHDADQWTFSTVPKRVHHHHSLLKSL